MYSVKNKYQNNQNYVSKSAITKSWLIKNNFPKSVSIKEVKENFNNAKPFWGKVGLSFDNSKQKHIKYVQTKELYNLVVKGFNRNK